MNLKELLLFIQSANINFLIGSGASRPYLSTLGNVEQLLTQLSQEIDANSKEYKVIQASIYKSFYESVILPNKFNDEKNENFILTRNSYKKLLLLWNDIIANRHSSILNRQINLFTTNIDLLIEKSSVGLGVELNDGFHGTISPTFSETNFMRSISQTSQFFNHTSEIPVFNLLKMHGSINWTTCATNEILYNSNPFKPISACTSKMSERCFINLSDISPTNSITELKSKAEDILSLFPKVNYDPFLEAYNKLIIVNPTKAKFVQTVMDYHFYEIMRMYSNALEKENTLLIVIGFSFEDEHIQMLTKRAAMNNPTLKILIFVYDEKELNQFKAKFPEELKNVEFIVTSRFRNENAQLIEESTLNFSEFKNFDLESINMVFELLKEQIYETK